MSKRRKRWNAICADMTKTEFTGFRPKDPRSREQIIVDIVSQECGRYSLSTIDDLASNIICKLWEDEQFANELDDIRAYVRGCIRIELLKIKRARERPASQMAGDNEDFDAATFLEFLGAFTGANQHTRAVALEAYFLTLALPADQCMALHILAGGGSPIDVAREMEMEPWEALRLIKEARQNIYRVDPRWDEAA